MHGFLRGLPEARREHARGEQEERDRVLTLIRLRKEPLERGHKTPEEADPTEAVIAQLGELERAVINRWRQ